MTANDHPGQRLEEKQDGSAEKPARFSAGLLRDPIPWLAGLIVVGLDQFTKWLVVANLDRGESFPAHGFVRITHAWNTGAAFGLLQDYGGLLTWVSVLAVFALFFLYRSIVRPPWYMRTVFGLLIGGAAGNLIDRIRIGHVTDFVDIGPFFIFNVADSAISVGIAFMFLYFWINGDRQREVNSIAGQSEEPPLPPELTE